MKYKITVNDKTYEVEIEDINARPVVARVDGTRFEVIPESGSHTEVKKDADEIQNRAEKKSSTTNRPAGASTLNPILNSSTLTAPLPGTVTEVFFKAGDQVEAGQVVLIIEAMKMKNSIRSTHGGAIKEVLVGAGQSVMHKQALVKFADAGEAA
jgi:biotin carboxyl carrier protein